MMKKYYQIRDLDILSPIKVATDFSCKSDNKKIYLTLFIIILQQRRRGVVDAEVNNSLDVRFTNCKLMKLT